jgi:predicted phosphodiesterase
MARRKIADEIAAGIEHASQLATDAELARLRAEVATYRNRYKAALGQIDKERERADAVVSLRGSKTIRPKVSAKKGKRHAATMVLMLSDVHCEERVTPETVNGENDYSLDVCEKRLNELLSRFFLMLDHERHLVDVRRVMVWLGGDFITGHIHPDCAEVAQLSPQKATLWIQARLRGIIDAIAERVSEVVVATNAGNHGRSTEKNRIATELDHSWEQYMFQVLCREESNANVRWQIGTGHLNYIDLDGFTVRACHGHNIRYSGGVYGLALPASKAIAAWDAHHRADLTIFGHYHTWGWLRGGRYVSNGSVIGHSPYAVAIKASPERPCQGCVVIDHGRNEVTKAYPLFCDEDLKKGKK